MERKGLGKGLGALFQAEERHGFDSVSEIDVSSVVLNPRQPRESMDNERFAELVSSVQAHGVIQPIVVRRAEEGGYELIAGERRLKAARAAGLKRVPAVVRTASDEDSLQIALIENIQREDINPIDAAVSYRRLAADFGLSQEEIAAGLGKSRSAVANTMRLLALPEEVIASLRSGRISEGHARAVLGLGNPADQVSMCRQVEREGLSVRDAEKLARQKGEEARGGERNVSRETTAHLIDPIIVDIETRLREVLGTKVTIVKGKGRSRIEVEFYSDDDLDRLLLLLAGF